MKLQDSNFFQMFDVDGDGLISYSEYLLLITFLSIPVEVSLALPPPSLTNVQSFTLRFHVKDLGCNSVL